MFTDGKSEASDWVGDMSREQVTIAAKTRKIKVTYFFNTIYPENGETKIERGATRGFTA
jgi:hypothetical protein